jgi:hypothetical protein
MTVRIKRYYRRIDVPFYVAEGVVKADKNKIIEFLDYRNDEYEDNVEIAGFISFKLLGYSIDMTVSFDDTENLWFMSVDDEFINKENETLIKLKNEMNDFIDDFNNFVNQNEYV